MGAVATVVETEWQGEEMLVVVTLVVSDMEAEEAGVMSRSTLVCKEYSTENTSPLCHSSLHTQVTGGSAACMTKAVALRNAL